MIMKNNHLFLTLFFGAVIFFVTSCDKKIVDENLDKTIINGFYFAKNDSFPSIGNTVFYVNADTAFSYQGHSYTGMIKNRDSMLYGTCLDTVSPVILVTYSVSHIKMLYTQAEKEQTQVYSDNDTLPFTHPVTLEVTSKDQKHTQRYLVQANVHQIDHELYVWNEKEYPPVSEDVVGEKAFFFKGRIFFFIKNSSSINLYTRSNAEENWKMETLVGLSSDSDIETMVCTGKEFYLIAENTLYNSTDGVNWTSKSLSGTFSKTLFHIDDDVFALKQEGDKNYIAKSTDKGDSWSVMQNSPSALPTDGFSYLSRSMPSGKTQCTIISNNGIFATENGEYWITLPNSASRNSPQRTFATAFFYDHKLFLFGGLEKGEMSQKLIFSSDYGMTWNNADKKTDAFSLNEDLQSSQKTSIVVDDVNHDIYILGGQNVNGEFLKKVWKGKKNETFFTNYK